VANSYPNREVDLNYSVQVALFRILRRRPWKMFAHRTWDAVSRLFLATLFATSLTLLLATAAQAKTYDAVTIDVPFKFSIGERTFPPGRYQLIIKGNGLLALRDAHAHTIASLVTRSVDIGEPAADTHLVFKMKNNHVFLTQLLMEHRSQALEVMGEELALRQPSPLSPPPEFNAEVDALFERRSSPGMRH
jgi:hypothetical protein